jgi:RimJ/RimL family protein N-acetyltransferase
LQTNEAVINLHLKFGFEQEGVKRDHCFIDNQFQNVVLMGITKNDYLKMSNL